MTQYVINIGAIPNDGTGDPLRTAFNETNLNFNQVFAAGPVLSNVRIANNTVLTTNTNGNLVLATNGTGIIQANVSIVPNLANLRNLGSALQRWNTVYTQYVDVSGPVTFDQLTVTGNLTVNGNIIQIGNLVTDAKTIQLANTAGTANAANGSGITVGANDNIATFLFNSAGGNRWTTNIGLQVAGLANVASLLVNQTANAWIISGNIISAPSGASWRSDPVFLDEYITSAVDGYINLTSLYASGNTASQVHLEHGLAQIVVDNGVENIWAFDSTGNLTLPGNTFAVNYANGNPVTINSSSYGNANVATFLADFGSNTVSTTGNITSNYYVGNAAVLAGQNTRGEHAANLGSAGFTELNSNVILQITGNANSYAQINFQNIGNGTAATTDYIATAQFGTDSTYFVNMGIASGTYDSSSPDNSLGNSLYAQDSYLYAMGGNSYGGSGGNLVVGSNEPGGVVRIIADGSTTDNIVATFSNTGIDVKGNIVPTSNNVFSLGNATNQWNDLYVSNATIFMNNVPISLTAGNVLTVDGNAVLTNGSNTAVSTTGNITAANVLTGGIVTATGNITGNYFIGNGSQLTGIITNTGNVTFNNQAVVGTGDQQGASGLYLAPGTQSVGNLQYLRVRGGDLPTHIHLDTGNNTYFDQYFGDDNKYIKLVNTGNIVINTNNLVDASAQWTFGTDGNLTLPGATAGETIATQGGYITVGNLLIGQSGALFNSNNDSWALYGNLSDPGATIFIPSNSDAGNGTALYIESQQSNVEIRSGSSTWNFDSTGNLTVPGNIIMTTGIVGSGASPAPSLSGFSSVSAVTVSASGNISATGNVTSGNVSTGVITLTNGATIRDTSGDAVAFGQNAGLTSQGNFAVGIGRNAGQTTQGGAAVAIGVSAGDTSQGNSAVAVGQSAGFTNQSANTVAIGVGAGQSSQGVDAVAVGASAGSLTQGIAAVAIGTLAGRTFQANNSIIINATGANLDQTTANTFTVAPVRNDVANTAQVMFYNTTSKEITYGNVISVAGNITSGNLTVGSGTITGGNVNGAVFNGNVAFGTGTVGGSGNITGGNLITTGSGGSITMTGGNITGAGNIAAGNVSTTGNITAANFFGNGNTLSNVATTFESTWTVPVGNSTQSFTVPINNMYQLWVLGNIPNGIIVYNATVSVSNTNVPVIGQQFAWNYEGGGNILMFTSIPAQIIGTAGAISNAQPAVANTNVFTFGINNTSGNTVTVNYGYTKIS
jgi:hypothetical protein